MPSKVAARGVWTETSELDEASSCKGNMFLLLNPSGFRRKGGQKQFSICLLPGSSGTLLPGGAACWDTIVCGERNQVENPGASCNMRRK